MDELKRPKELDEKNIQDILALTPMQEGMLFHYLKDPRQDYYFEQLSLEISGEIDRELFDRAWNFVIQTNEMLRTVFRWEKMKKPIQVVLNQHRIKPIMIDLSTGKIAEKEKRLENIKIEDRNKKFDLRSVPFRITFCKMTADRYVMILSNHHILYDGWSNGILLSEFFSAYDDLSKGKALVRPVKRKFKEFIQWTRSQDLNKQNREKFWRNFLKGFDTPTPLAIKKQKRGKKVTLPGKCTAPLGKNVTIEINRFIREHKLTLASFLYTAWGFLLQRYNNLDDIIFGTTVSGRSAKLKGIENIVGLFINTLPLRIKTLPGETILDCLLGTNDLLQKREEFERSSLVEIREYSEINTDEEFFDSIVVIENYPLDTRLQEGNTGLSVNSYSMFEMTHYDLTVGIWISEEIEVNFIYNSESFDNETIERLTNHFKGITGNMLKNPGANVPDMEIISEEEKRKLLYDFNDTGPPFPLLNTIHELFARQVGKTPDHIALGGEEGTRELDSLPGLIYITYNQLNEKCNQLAYLLKEKGVKPENIVGIMVERSIEMIIGILGILKAGGAYLPIDPNYPQERIKYMLKDSNAETLLTTPKLQVKVKAEVKENSGQPRQLSLQLIDIETKLAPAFEPSLLTLTSTCQVSPANLAYVIYTSGSTGNPRGVPVKHSNFSQLVHWGYDLGLGPWDRVIQNLSYYFDWSVWEIFITLTTGAGLFMITGEILLNPEAQVDFIIEKGITVLHVTPTQYQYLVNEGKKLDTLKYLFIGAEKLTVDLVKRSIASVNKNCRIFNMYGPTEATIISAVLEIHPLDVEKYIKLTSVPIGKPVGNMELLVVDRYMNICPLGVTGELYIAGDGLAAGYLNNPELTAEKFDHDLWDYQDYHDKKREVEKIRSLEVKKKKKNYIHNSPLTPHHSTTPPLHHSPHSPYSTIYRTGDLARWLADGIVEFMGRVDFQVKVRGYRIELSEIENHLLDHDAVREAVVIDREFETGEKYLCGYVVLEENTPLDDKETMPSELRKYLSQTLPDYMIPPYFIRLDHIPLNPNGKIHRNALPGPERREHNHYTAPRNELEKKLVETWKQVLGRKHIGVNENFFELGGDSIKSIQAASRMTKAGYKVEVKDILNHPKISQLAPLVKKIERVIHQAAVTGNLPLTPIQEEFFSFPLKKTHHFNMSKIFYLKDEPHQEVFQAIFIKIQQHHDALRMTFRKIDGKVIQVNHGTDYPFSFRTYDFRNRKEGSTAFDKKVKELQASLDLENGPLMKVAIFHLMDSDRLVIVVHHLVIDGISWRILFEDIETLYQQHKEGKSFLLPLKTNSFKQWSQQLLEYANSEAFLKTTGYWKQLESLTVPAVKRDIRGGSNHAKDTSVVSFQLSTRNTRLLLTRVNRAFNTTINDILLTALGLAFKKSFGHNRLLIALEGHGREQISKNLDINRTVGWFTAVYPVILNLAYTENLDRQVKEIKENLNQAPDKGVGYGILKYLTAKEHKKGIDFKLEPQVCFNYLGQFDTDLQQMSFALTESFISNSMGLEEQRKYDFDISGILEKGQLVMSISYSNRQYKPGTIKSLWNHFKNELKRVISYCSTRRKKEFTPSDFTYKGLSIEMIRRLQNRYLIKDIFTLSPMQEGMLFHALEKKDLSTYFQQISYRIHGELNVIFVKKALEELFKRHEIFRTIFISEKLDKPIQIVLEEREVEFYFEDIRSKITGENEKYLFARKFKEADRQRSFNLAKDVLFRAAVLQVSEAEYEIVWSFHHIILDGWSVGILIPEFLEIYSSLVENREYNLSPTRPYRAYIQWLKEQDQEKYRRYWLNYLRDYREVAGIPGMKSKKETRPGFKNEEQIFVLERQETRRLDELTGRNQVTVNTIIQTVWGIVLGKNTGKQDVVFGLVVSGRPPGIEGVESMVGCFINTIPIRIRYEENTKLSDLLPTVRQEGVESAPYHYYPLARIQSETGLKQNLLDHILVFENYPQEIPIEDLNTRLARSGTGLVLSNLQFFSQTNYDFYIMLIPGDQLTIRLKYNANVYEPGLIRKLGTQFLKAIDRVLSNPGIHVDELNLLTQKKKQDMLSNFNDELEDE